MPVRMTPNDPVPYGLPENIRTAAEQLTKALAAESGREGNSVGEINAYIRADNAVSNMLLHLNFDLHDARANR